jgi:hypothetical protein
MGNKGEIADELAEVLVLLPKKFALKLLSMMVKMLTKHSTYSDRAKSSRLLDHIKVVRNQSFIQHTLK